ncbi:hypothetical protein, partial [Nocardia cyriacigeorgica]|uniref:hypothetical protein n=1 Tax=Nocardia cyriacigeorgica TaxID=135487 RepID=UPI0024561E71
MPVDPGPCAVELAPASVAVARTFHDCLLLHIYVEPGERGPSGEVVRAIQAMIAQSAAAYVVINGSPVLPSGAGPPAQYRPDQLAQMAPTHPHLDEKPQPQ